MEMETIKNLGRGKGVRIKERILGHQFMCETINRTSKLMNISLSGYMSQASYDASYELSDKKQVYTTKLRKLRGNTRIFIYDLVQDLFFPTNQERLIQQLNISKITTDKLIDGGWGYFDFDICIYCNYIIDLRDQELEDKVRVFAELLIEYLYDNQDFNFKIRK